MEASSCHTSSLNRVVLDIEKSVSKATLSIALTAYTTGKKVDIDTYSDCIDGVSMVRKFYFFWQCSRV